jgi:hypothetical protein
MGSVGAALMLLLQLYMGWWQIAAIIGAFYAVGFLTLFILRNEPPKAITIQSESDPLVAVGGILDLKSSGGGL